MNAKPRRTKDTRIQDLIKEKWQLQTQLLQLQQKYSKLVDVFAENAKAQALYEPYSSIQVLPSQILELQPLVFNN